MPEFEVAGVAYRSRRLSAAEQWGLLQRLAPMLPALSGIDLGLRLPGLGLKEVASLMAPLARAKDSDLTSVFRMCTDLCERRPDEVWEPVPHGQSLSTLLGIVMAVVSQNFGQLFAMERVKFQPIPLTGGNYQPVAMPKGEDWLYRPFMRGRCFYSELHDGTLQIHDVARINDLIDVADENEARARKAAEAK